MKTTISLFLLGSFAVAPLHAQDKASPEARMREALRNTMLQLRTVQAEKDDLTFKKDQAEQQVATLEGQVKALTKRASEDKEAFDAVKAKLVEEEARSRQLTAQLEEWKAACHKAADLAKKVEGERALLTEKAIILERTIVDQRDRNAAMYKIGTEILRRYENFGLGTAITAREPFVGTTRVKLENLVQDYSDKLADQRIKK
jgi:chromosome segregation ATPase